MVGCKYCLTRPINLSVGGGIYNLPEILSADYTACPPLPVKTHPYPETSFIL
jgi:hypothetical protein